MTYEEAGLMIAAVLALIAFSGLAVAVVLATRYHRQWKTAKYHLEIRSELHERDLGRVQDLQKQVADLEEKLNKESEVRFELAQELYKVQQSIQPLVEQFAPFKRVDCLLDLQRETRYAT